MNDDTEPDVPERNCNWCNIPLDKLEGFLCGACEWVQKQGYDQAGAEAYWQAQYDAAPEIPISKERIRGIVDHVTGKK